MERENMTNGLIKGRITVFLNDGKIAYQGFNTKTSGKILGYVKIDSTYTNMNEFDVNFNITEESLKLFAERNEKQ